MWMISLFISEQNLAMSRLSWSPSFACAPCILGVPISASCCEWGQQCASTPNVRKWTCSPIEPHVRSHVQRGMLLLEEKIDSGVKLHHIRNSKLLRDSLELQGDNKVFRSIKTFTAELKGLLISVCTTENAGKHWPQMYFFRLKS